VKVDFLVAVFWDVTSYSFVDTDLINKAHIAIHRNPDILLFIKMHCLQYRAYTKECCGDVGKLVFTPTEYQL
jgi:hypothetical protein